MHENVGRSQHLLIPAHPVTNNDHLLYDDSCPSAVLDHSRSAELWILLPLINGVGSYDGICPGSGGKGDGEDRGVPGWAIAIGVIGGVALIGVAGVYFWRRRSIPPGTSHETQSLLKG